MYNVHTVQTNCWKPVQLYCSPTWKQLLLPGWTWVPADLRQDSSPAGKPKTFEVPGVENTLFTNIKFSKNLYHYAVRRTQNSLNLIENDKLISNMNSPNLFEEIKKACKETNSNVTSVIDDIHGAKNITEHFKTIYENLYNEQEDIDEDFIDEICDKVDNTS